MTKYLLIFLLVPILAYADSAKFLAQVEKQISASLEDKIQLGIEKQQLEDQIKEMQIKIKERKALIVKRLRALYALKQYKWSELLVDTNLNEFERNVKIINNLNKYDYDIFKEYNTALKQLGLARKNLIETEALIEQNVKALQEQQGDFHRLETTHLADLQKEKKDSLLIFKGTLSRPLDGKLKQEFGSLRDQYKLFYMINRGELYNCKANTPVKAVGLGQVIFRDVLSRWRETLIVQHDDNYYSVYAGVKNTKKKPGDHVEKNELLGTCAGDEFYFELRHFDNPINPKTWYRE
jgi:septal ring factor EnvC (AmiA/AmiB activator)